jgi:hypothetical protein
MKELLLQNLFLNIRHEMPPPVSVDVSGKLSLSTNFSSDIYFYHTASADPL